MVIMCGCGKIVERPKGYITQAKVIIRKVWENTQIQEKPVTVKKINKT